jgi:methylphosphotriester-DNA--protein-cysteine methyltransferase
MACGSPSAKGMRLVFKRVTGMTPLEYRRAKQVRSV